MKALICKQANKLTTIGKCYPVIIKVDSTGYESNNIVLDNGLVAVVSDDNNLYCGAPTGIAKFDCIDVHKECYLAQPALTVNESKWITLLALLDVLSITGLSRGKIKESLAKDLLEVMDDNKWANCQRSIKEANVQDDWLERALLLADDHMNKKD